VIVLRLLRLPDGAEAAAPGVVVAARGTTIGRASECDLVLDERHVSRRHAWLVPQGVDEALVRCISVSAPLFVNGDLLPPGGERPVHGGDRLRIGGFEISVERREAAAAVAAPVQPVPPVPTRPRPPRLDKWFELDTVADPLGPFSPLPDLDGAALAELPSQAGLADAAPLPRVRPDPPAVAAVPIVPAAEADPAGGGRDALQQAFLRGAGLDAGTPFELGPAEMAHLGALLRAATEGMLGLLRSRAVAESSLHGEGTRIVARANNPLKFVPDATHALLLLLAPQGRRGFLAPVEAVRDAHDELQIHQLAMLAGMRAAVFDLIAQLGPEAAEAARGPTRGITERLPALRDAALWRRHRQGHARLLENLDDVFDSTFGREFLRAYEAQARWADEAVPKADECDLPLSLPGRGLSA
jgi:type VI secretion system FHA domain protein